MCAIVSLDLTKALHPNPADDALPSFTGDLSSSVSPVTMTSTWRFWVRLKGINDAQVFDKVIIAGDFNVDFHHRGTT